MDKKKKYIRIFLVAIFDSIAFCISLYLGNLIVRPNCQDWPKALLESAIVALFCIIIITIFVNVLNRHRPKSDISDVIVLPLMVLMITVIIGIYYYTLNMSKSSAETSAKANEVAYEQSDTGLGGY